MSLPASSERRIASSALGAALVVALGWLAGCSSPPPRKALRPAPHTQLAPAAAAPASAPSAGQPGTAPGASAVPADSPSTPAVRPEVSEAARADFDRAVDFMRSG